MLDDETAMRIFREFRGLRSASTPLTPLVVFPDVVGQEPVRDGVAAIYRTMASEHVRELANFANEFIFYMHDLRAWRDLIAPLGDEERVEIAMEFVLPLAYYCVGVPYALSGRICVSVASLSHQANRVTVDGWRDDVNLRYIDAAKAAKYAEGWSEWPRVAAALGELNDPRFVAAVGDFRRLFHHGFPRSLEMGLTSFMRREVYEGKVRYAIGATEPLTVAELFEALTPQVLAAKGAYDAYVGLVREQWERIRAA